MGSLSIGEFKTEEWGWNVLEEKKSKQSEWSVIKINQDLSKAPQWWEVVFIGDSWGQPCLKWSPQASKLKSGPGITKNKHNTTQHKKNRQG